ncbi:MAG: hypothetical protein JXQ75_05185 [Phycisphaerae bacterium]|nr:hypothetical protein [Phycisphaerae bacterium]
MAQRRLTNGGDGPERDAHGRYLPGNHGGPGNPFAGQVASLRMAAMKAIPIERLARIFDALAMKAEDGDAMAAKIVLGYVLGRPTDFGELVRLEEAARQAEAFTARFGDVFEVE